MGRMYLLYTNVPKCSGEHSSAEARIMLHGTMDYQPHTHTLHLASMGKGNLRVTYRLAKDRKIAGDGVAREGDRIARMSAFLNGTLTEEQVALLRGPQKQDYIVRFFQKCGFEFADDSRPWTCECGSCVKRALGFEDGYISDDELDAARQALLAHKGERRHPCRK